jgi:hypothetical protein
MDWLEILYKVFELCLIPLLAYGTTWLVKWLKAKESEINNKLDNETAEKYISMVAQTITDCVIATNQTYVESLKKQGSFDVEAQKIAFQKTYEAVMAVLSDDAKEYLTALYGDATAYLTARIEAEVNLQK